MSEFNPYSTPQASLGPTGAGPGRPVGVWLIFLLIMTCCATVLVTYSLAFALWVSGELPEEVRALWARAPFRDFMLSVLFWMAAGAAAVQLFRLRRTSVYLFAGLTVLYAVVIAWHMSQGAVVSASDSSVWIVLSLLAIDFYGVVLTRRGVLTAGRDRPFWVWLIAGYFSCLMVWAGMLNAWALSGEMPALEPLPDGRVWPTLTSLDVALSMAYWGLSLWAAGQLFRLRRSSVALFVLAWIVGVAGTVWQGFEGWVSSWADWNLWLSVGFLAVSLAVYFYARRLDRVGVLA